MKYTVPVEIRFNDVDGLGHVNNATYLTFLEHARMRFFTEEGAADSEQDLPFILAHASLDYKKPVKLGAKLEVTMWTSRVGGKSWDFDYEVADSETRVLYATGKTVQVAYDYFRQKSDKLEGALLTLVETLKP